MDSRLEYYTYKKEIKFFLDNLKHKKILQIFLEHNFASSFFVQITYNYVEKQYYIYFTKKDEEIVTDVKNKIMSSSELVERYKNVSKEKILEEYFSKDDEFSNYIISRKIKKQDGYIIEDILKKNRLEDIEGPTNILDGWRYNILTSYLGEKRTYSFQTYIEKGYEELGKIIEIVFSYLPDKQKIYGKNKIQYKI